MPNLIDKYNNNNLHQYHVIIKNNYNNLYPKIRKYLFLIRYSKIKDMSIYMINNCGSNESEILKTLDLKFGVVWLHNPDSEKIQKEIFITIGRHSKTIDFSHPLYIKEIEKETGATLPTPLISWTSLQDQLPIWDWVET